jgi:hypothetical protein
MDECAYTKKIDVHCATGLPIFSYAAKKTGNTNTYTQISEEKLISSLGSFFREFVEKMHMAYSVLCCQL